MLKRYAHREFIWSAALAIFGLAVCFGLAKSSDYGLGFLTRIVAIFNLVRSVEKVMRR